MQIKIDYIVSCILSQSLRSSFMSKGNSHFKENLLLTLSSWIPKLSLHSFGALTSFFYSWQPNFKTEKFFRLCMHSKTIFHACSNRICGRVVSLETGRREVPGSNLGRACRPSRSEFSVVFSETRVNTG